MVLGLGQHVPRGSPNLLRHTGLKCLHRLDDSSGLLGWGRAAAAVGQELGMCLWTVPAGKFNEDMQLPLVGKRGLKKVFNIQVCGPRDSSTGIRTQADFIGSNYHHPPCHFGL